MKKNRYRFGPVIFLLLLLGVGFWLYQSPGVVTANYWSWDDQLQMEATMAKVAQTSQAKIPAIDRRIPETETALFALG